MEKIPLIKLSLAYISMGKASVKSHATDWTFRIYSYWFIVSGWFVSHSDFIIIK